MALSPIDPTDVEALLTRALELSVPLHEAIRPFDEPGTSYRLSGPPGVALFQRDAGDTIAHVSGTPSPLVMPALDDLRARHLRGAGVADGVDNSHLPSLLLLCIYLADPETSRRFELDRIVTRPAQVLALDEEEGRHDPELEPLDAALRAWTPLVAEHALDAGEHPAILELRFPANRYTRHVPWEGRLGETAQAPGHP